MVKQIPLETMKENLERVRVHANNELLSPHVRHAALVIIREMEHAIREREKGGATRAGPPVHADTRLRDGQRTGDVLPDSSGDDVP